MATPYYNNDADEPIWMYTSMSRAGAVQIAKTMRDKLGCTILEQPILRDDEVWVVMFTNPWMKS